MHRMYSSSSPPKMSDVERLGCSPAGVPPSLRQEQCASKQQSQCNEAETLRQPPSAAGHCADGCEANEAGQIADCTDRSQSNCRRATCQELTRHGPEGADETVQSGGRDRPEEDASRQGCCRSNEAKRDGC